MLELFPLTREQLFKLPDLAIDSQSGVDSYKSLFLNELLALEVSAKRNLAPATYVRHPDGSCNLSLQDTVLDVSTFYLFAHKILVSSIFIFAKTVPHDRSRGIKFNSYTAFKKDVFARKNDTLERVFRSCGKGLTWAQVAIIDKRDNLVQHWQGNTSTFFPAIYAWDLPYLVYYDPCHVNQIDEGRVATVLAAVKPKIRGALDPNADLLQKIAWMDAWKLSLSSQLQQDINDLGNDRVFITLPVNELLINKLDHTISNLLKQAVELL